MKKIIITAIALLFAVSALAAEVFVPITKDSEVTDINNVQVKKVITTEQTAEVTYTLPDIDAKIAKIQARIDHLQGDIDELLSLKGKVMTEASKIKLKKEEVVKEEVK